jgi:hypothetical protein
MQKRKLLVFYGLCMLPVIVFGQYQLEKSILNPDIQHIQFRAAHVFKLEVKTHAKKEINISYALEGEYQQNFEFNIIEEGAKLFVDIRPHAMALFPNDKLGAHKVVVIAVELVMPEQKSLEVEGDYTDIWAQGNFKKIRLRLQDGSCFLGEINGIIEVLSQKGNISYTGKQKNIYANSSYGKLKGVFQNDPKSNIKLKTITGDIFIDKKIE